MIQNDLKVLAQAAPWSQCVEFLVADDKSVGVNVMMADRQDMSDNGRATEPTFRLPFHAAQTLMDDLWAAGLRPTEGAGSAGAFQAQQKHLEDMRALVFKTPAK